MIFKTTYDGFHNTVFMFCYNIFYIFSKILCLDTVKNILCILKSVSWHYIYRMIQRDEIGNCWLIELRPLQLDIFLLWNNRVKYMLRRYITHIPPYHYLRTLIKSKVKGIISNYMYIFCKSTVPYRTFHSLLLYTAKLYCKIILTSTVPHCTPLSRALITIVAQLKPLYMELTNTMPHFTPFYRAPTSTVPHFAPFYRAPTSTVPHFTPLYRALISNVPHFTPLFWALTSTVPHSTPLYRAPTSTMPHFTPLYRAPTSTVPLSWSDRILIKLKI